MGNLCMRISDHDFTLKKKINRATCIKCNDRFDPKHGRYSDKKSCRVHHFKKKIYLGQVVSLCIYCNLKKPIDNYIGQNCYHVF